MHENCVPREEFDKVVSELQALRKLVAELQARLERYEGPHTPPSMRGMRYPKREPTGRPPGKPEGSNGATRKLEHRKPDEVVPIKPKTCSNCKHYLGEPIGWIKQLVEEIPEPQPAKLLEFQKGICICQNCGTENIAADARCPTKGELGPRTLAFVQDLRFKERFSILMARRFLKERFGLEVSPGTILNMTSRTVKMLKSSQNVLAMRIRRSQVVYVDETGFYINGERVWLWIFATENDVLVAIRYSRGSRVPKQILGKNYRGVVVSDCFSAYDLLKKQLKKAKFQKCWAHLLRESKACAQQCEEGKQIHAELKVFFSKMKSFIDSDPQPDERSVEQQAALEWLDRLLMNDPSEHRIKKLLKRLSKHREDWFTCLLMPDVEPTNNRAERGIRPQVILRRLRGSLRSERGKEDHEVMTSLMASWELKGLNSTTELENELCRSFAGS